MTTFNMLLRSPLPYPGNLVCFLKNHAHLPHLLNTQLKMLGQKFEICGDKDDDFCNKGAEASCVHLITG